MIDALDPCSRIVTEVYLFSCWEWWASDRALRALLDALSIAVLTGGERAAQ